jgi:hypothetical protein
MACPQPDKLIVSSPEELIGGHHYRLDPLLGEARKGGIDIRLAARILYYQPSASAAACASLVWILKLGSPC